MSYAPRSIRSRLALGYAIAVAITVLIYAAVVYGFTRSALTDQLDARLRSDFEQAEHGFEQGPDGVLRWKAEADVDGHHPDPSEEKPWAQVRGNGSAQAIFRPDGIDPHAPCWRTYEQEYVLGDVACRVRVGRSTGPRDEELRDLLWLLGFCFVPVVGLAWLAGSVLARRALRPVEVMTDRARHIGAERLQDRLPVKNPDDELGRLARVFNEAFGRIEVSFERLRRFTSDAAHELRTPLAALRAVGEVGLAKNGDRAQSREVIASMLEETNRLTRLVDGLLELSRGDARTALSGTEPVDLVALARSVCEQLEVLAAERDQALTLSGAECAEVRGDPASLRRAVTNLVDNAIRHGPPSAPIRVHVDADSATVRLAVEDEGPGVAEEHRARIFDRFYRVDPSRKGASSGLGLALASQAVRAHGGDIEHVTRPGGGTTFRATLPRAIES